MEQVTLMMLRCTFSATVSKTGEPACTIAALTLEDRNLMHSLLNFPAVTCQKVGCELPGSCFLANTGVLLWFAGWPGCKMRMWRLLTWLREP